MQPTETTAPRPGSSEPEPPEIWQMRHALETAREALEEAEGLREHSIQVGTALRGIIGRLEGALDEPLSRERPIDAEHTTPVDPRPALLGEKGGPLLPQVLAKAWGRARATIGHPDLRLHDLRHSGLTWAAATGATVAELMRRGGHASPAAALRYQHATDDRDQALAAALTGLASKASVVVLQASRSSSSG